MEHEFWNLVQRGGPDDCWPWAHTLFPNGYGYFRRHLAHRVAYELANGPIPAGLLVCHACDNPPCCNPAHLWLGTQSDNAQDRNRKGRGRDRSTYSRALVDPDVVRARYAAGETQQAIADSLGIAQATVSVIVRGVRGW